ncbi:integrase core domain-containing protein [Deinococcus hopiensis]|uniref:integrase core domain-containing protein n=1 Tax=Deinococcus hopiensis TaxID=309885 RepID=UPI000A010CC7|nr:integrase core domain-containing protein [Deinococcus hopiensis]
MSSKGQCWDNAVQERFFSTLKVELDLRQAPGTCAQTRSDVFAWIEVFYNRQRRHSSPCCRSPVAFEEQTTHLNYASTKPLQLHPQVAGVGQGHLA